jgi:hypothetical protein
VVLSTHTDIMIILILSTHTVLSTNTILLMIRERLVARTSEWQGYGLDTNPGPGYGPPEICVLARDTELKSEVRCLCLNRLHSR